MKSIINDNPNNDMVNPSVIFSPFGSQAGPEYPSKIYQYDGDGFCFESDHYLKKGTILFIRTSGHPKAGIRFGQAVPLRTSSLVEVKQCRRKLTKAGTSFLVDVKYY